MRPIKWILNICVGPQVQSSPKVGSAPRKPVSAPKIQTLLNATIFCASTVGPTYAANFNDEGDKPLLQS